MNLYITRMLRAAKLDISLYEEVEKDQSAMPQAMGVVILAGVAAGIGSTGMGTTSGGDILIGIIAALGGWYIWAFLAYFIGTKILPEPQTSTDYGELLRTVGFSSSPGLIRVLGVIPGVGAIAFLVASIWMIVAMVFAVRQALDYKSTWRAAGVCLIGWLFQALVVTFIFSLFVTPQEMPVG